MSESVNEKITNSNNNIDCFYFKGLVPKPSDEGQAAENDPQLAVRRPRSGSLRSPGSRGLWSVALSRPFRSGRSGLIAFWPHAPKTSTLRRPDAVPTTPGFSTRTFWTSHASPRRTPLTRNPGSKPSPRFQRTWGSSIPAIIFFVSRKQRRVKFTRLFASRHAATNFRRRVRAAVDENERRNGAAVAVIVATWEKVLSRNVDDDDDRFERKRKKFFTAGCLPFSTLFRC